MRIETRWREGMVFEATGGAGVAVTIDGDGAVGPTPVEALLIGLATCMGADIVDILAKMRVPLSECVVLAEGDRRAEPPRRYTAVRLVCRTVGVAASDREKLQRAVDLSRERYCSVLHTLRPDLELTIAIETG